MTGELAYGAITGLADAVGDTGHTSFLTPEERAARSATCPGSYVGIGVRIDPGEDGRPRDGGADDDQDHDRDQGRRDDEGDGRDREVREGREEELQATGPQLAALGGTMLADWMGP